MQNAERRVATNSKQKGNNYPPVASAKQTNPETTDQNTTTSDYRLSGSETVKGREHEVTKTRTDYVKEEK